MKRRKFGIFAGSGVAVAVSAKASRAQSVTPDASLLTTTLTPIGAERAGNADGSIPAWTGGMTSPTLPPDQSMSVQVFTDEQPLYRVDASNLSQYQALINPGTAFLIKNNGLVLPVYPSHRTAAFPQFVYDNAAKNVTRAKLDPAGGRFGFTGAYGAPAFPIIDTSDPLVGGAQLIWNHLTQWAGTYTITSFSPALVVSSGQVELSDAQLTRNYYPYYDPNGSPETFDGYYSKLLIYSKAPASILGQEQLVWHTTNSNIKPDIVWTLLNGQGRVRKAPDEAYDTPDPSYNGIANIDESQGFYGSPQKFDWKYIGKQEMLIPYNCNSVLFKKAEDFVLPKGINGEFLRWEKHRVWVVEATLHPGERNVLPRRRFYLDEDCWGIILGESYDADGNMVRAYNNPYRIDPSMPMMNPIGILVFNLVTGDYVFNGDLALGANASGQFNAPSPSSTFDAEQMAASASF